MSLDGHLFLQNYISILHPLSSSLIFFCFIFCSVGSGRAGRCHHNCADGHLQRRISATTSTIPFPAPKTTHISIPSPSAHDCDYDFTHAHSPLCPRLQPCQSALATPSPSPRRSAETDLHTTRTTSQLPQTITCPCRIPSSTVAISHPAHLRPKSPLCTRLARLSPRGANRHGQRVRCLAKRQKGGDWVHPLSRCHACLPDSILRRETLYSRG